jgi:hypothetical protein
MELTPYVDDLRRELVLAADAVGEDARLLAERLSAPLESAARLTLLKALSAAADEITRDLAPGRVEVRLRGLDADFIVTPRPTGQPFEDAAEGSPGTLRGMTVALAVRSQGLSNVGEGTVSRINFRLPEHLKLQIEQAAGFVGLSVNAWLVLAVAAILESGDGVRVSSTASPSLLTLTSPTDPHSPDLVHATSPERHHSMSESQSASASDLPSSYLWWTARKVSARRLGEVLQQFETSIDRAIADAGGNRISETVRRVFAVQRPLAHLLDDRTVVLLTGMVNRGKSLVGTALLPGSTWTTSRAMPMTALPVRAVWSESRSAAIRKADGTEEPVAVDEALAIATQRPERETQFSEKDLRDVKEVIQYIPSDLLKSGVEIVDSPGLSDPGALNYDDVVEKEIEVAHVALLILECPPGIDNQEKAFLKRIGQRANKIVVVANMWRAVEDNPQDRQDFLATIQAVISVGAQAVGIPQENISIVPMNAKRAVAANESGDRTELQASGLDELLRVLTNVLGREVWTTRLGLASDLLFGARSQLIERAETLHKLADDSLDVARERSRLQQLETTASAAIEQWVKGIAEEQDDLSARAAAIAAHPYDQLQQMLEQSETLDLGAIQELHTLQNREAEAQFDALEKTFRIKLATRIGPEFGKIFGEAFVLSAVQPAPPSFQAPGPRPLSLVRKFVGIPIGILMLPFHPIGGAAVIAASLETKGAKARKFRADLDYERRKSIQDAEQWAVHLAAGIRDQVSTMASDRREELRRRRVELTTPILPERAGRLKASLESIIAALKDLSVTV